MMRFLTDHDVYQITIKNVHREFAMFLNVHNDMNFDNCFIVIEPNRHRIRHVE